jgi:hypothetical protein
LERLAWMPGNVPGSTEQEKLFYFPTKSIHVSTGMSYRKGNIKALI